MNIQSRFPFKPVCRPIMWVGLVTLAQMMGLAEATGNSIVEPQAPTEQPGAVPSDEISDEKLQTFALVANQVKEIQDEYAVKAELLQHETETRMVDAVESAGMSLEEFRSLVERLQTDPDLAARLKNMQPH